MKSSSAPAVALHGSPWYKNKLGDALVLGGVAASVVALVEYRSALGDLHDAEFAPTLASYYHLVDSAHSRRTTSVILAGTGGALIVAGIIRYVLQSAAGDVRTVGAAPTGSGGLVTYEGKF